MDKYIIYVYNVSCIYLYVIYIYIYTYIYMYITLTDIAKLPNGAVQEAQLLLLRSGTAVQALQDAAQLRLVQCSGVGWWLWLSMEIYVEIYGLSMDNLWIIYG